MLEYIAQNILANQIGGNIRYVILKFICRRKNITYRKVLYGISKVKTKQDDTFNIKNEMKNRLTTLAFFVLLILAFIVFGVI